MSFGTICLFVTILTSAFHLFDTQVCLCTIQEINNLLSVTDGKEKIEVGGFGFDQEVERVPAKKSEVYLSGMMDIVCDTMYMYGIFTNPKNKQKNVIRAHSFEGLHAPPTKRHTKQSPEITDTLMFACDSILEDFEDEIIQFFKNKDPNDKEQLEQKFCVEKAKLCTEASVKQQMWAMAEAALIGIGSNVNKPKEEDDPAMEDIEVEYLDLTDEGEAEEEEIRRNKQRLEEIRERRRLREEEEKKRKEQEEQMKKQEL